MAATGLFQEAPSGAVFFFVRKCFWVSLYGWMKRMFNMSKKEVRDDIGNTVPFFMSADEAKTWGVVDKVLK